MDFILLGDDVYILIVSDFSCSRIKKGEPREKHVTLKLWLMIRKRTCVFSPNYLITLTVYIHVFNYDTQRRLKMTAYHVSLSQMIEWTTLEEVLKEELCYECEYNVVTEWMTEWINQEEW